MNEEIVYADKNLRLWIILLILIIAAAGLWILELVQNYLRDIETLAESNPRNAARKLIIVAYVFGVFFGAWVLAFFGFSVWIGTQAIKTDRFPPPSMRVIIDTKVVRGTKAKLRGWMFIVLGILILISGCTVVVLGESIISNLLERVNGAGQVSDVLPSGALGRAPEFGPYAS